MGKSKKVIVVKGSDFLEISKSLLEGGRAISFRAKGWSMRPYIRDGDIVTVVPLNNTPLRKGEIVLFSTPDGRITLHRILRIFGKNNPMAFFVKGDAAFGRPERIQLQNILGRVVEIKRHERIRNHKSKRFQLLNYFLADITLFNKWIYPLGSRIKTGGRKICGAVLEKVQSPKLYRSAARKIIKKNIQYQIASSRDSASLRRLYNYADEKSLEMRKITTGSQEQPGNPVSSDYWIIAKWKNKMVGGVNVVNSQDREYPYAGWWIYGMKVDWRYRGLGIGDKLLRMATETAIKGRASEIRLLVFKDSKPALNLYKKMGFQFQSIPALDKQLDEEAKKTGRREVLLVKTLTSG